MAGLSQPSPLPTNKELRQLAFRKQQIREMQIRLNFLIVAFGGMPESTFNQGHPSRQLSGKGAMSSATAPDSPQINGGSASHLVGGYKGPPPNGGAAPHSARAYNGLQANQANPSVHISGLLYVNLVVLNRIVESIIMGKLQEFKDVNRSSPLDYNKPYLAWHDEMSFPPGYHQSKFQMFNGLVTRTNI